MWNFKEWHFHTYWNGNDEKQTKDAEEMFREVEAMAAKKKGIVPLRLNRGPVGPHPTASFETWVAVERFGEAWSYFATQRRGLKVLCHPLSPQEILDHTQRAAWFGGEGLVLDLSVLKESLPSIPAQYPEQEMGYSAKE